MGYLYLQPDDLFDIPRIPQAAAPPLDWIDYLSIGLLSAFTLALAVYWLWRLLSWWPRATTRGRLEVTSCLLWVAGWVAVYLYAANQGGW